MSVLTLSPPRRVAPPDEATLGRDTFVDALNKQAGGPYYDGLFFQALVQVLIEDRRLWARVREEMGGD